MLPETHPLMFRLRGGYSMKPASTSPAMVGALVAVPIFLLGTAVGLTGMSGGLAAFFGSVVVALPLVIAADAAWIVVRDARRRTYMLLVLPFDGHTIVSSYITMLQRRWRWFLIGSALLMPLWIIVSAEEVLEVRLHNHSLKEPNEALRECFTDYVSYTFGYNDTSDADIMDCFESKNVVPQRSDLPFAGLAAVRYTTPLDQHTLPGELLLLYIILVVGVVGLGYMGMGLGVALGMLWRRYMVLAVAAGLTLLIGVLLVVLLFYVVPVPDGSNDILVVVVWLQVMGLPFNIGALTALAAATRAHLVVD